MDKVFFENLKLALTDYKKIIFCPFFNEEEEKIVFENLKTIFDEKFLLSMQKMKKEFNSSNLIENFKKLLSQLKNEFEKICTILTAKQISNYEKNIIEKKISNFINLDNLQFKYEIKEEIINGICFYYDQKYYDASFSLILKQMMNYSYEGAIL